MTLDDILAKAPEKFQTGYLQEQCAIYKDHRQPHRGVQ